MKVCLITGEYPPLRGGVGDYTARLRQALEGVGVNTAVVTSKAAAASSEPQTWAVMERWGFGSWRTLARLLDSSQAQIAHLQYQTGAFGLHPAVNLLPLWLRRRWPQGSFITTFHDLRVPYLFPKAGPLRPYVNRLLLRHSQAAILTTEEYLAQAQAWARPDQALRLIPIGSNLTPAEAGDPRPIRAALGAKEEEFLLGFFGFLTPEKGLEELFAALSQLLQRGHRVRLAMIGGLAADTTLRQAQGTTVIDYHRQVMAMAAGLGLAEAICWTGFLEEAAASAHIAACDGLALPFTTGASFRHGSLMAALAHGRPLVTTDPRHRAASGPRLEDGENCLLAPPRDTSALADAIERLIVSPDLRHSLAQGAARLAQSFTWEAIATQTKELYQEVLDKKG